jgi:hypothetical protein
MSNQLLSSKIAIIEESPSVLPVQPAPTSITGSVGIAKRGPVGVATLIQSQSEYLKIFGGYTADSDLALAVKGFFEANSGGTMWVTRTVHYSDPTDPTTKTSAAATGTVQTSALASTAGAVTGSGLGPFVLLTADTLILKIDALTDITITFTATAAVSDSGNETFALTNGDQLTVKIDGGSVQTITFLTSEFADITNATALEVAAVLNAVLVGASAGVVGSAVRITSDAIGEGSHVEVTGGTANAALGFATSVEDGTGVISNSANGSTPNFDDVSAVTVTELLAGIAAAVTSTATASNSGGYPKVTSATLGALSKVQFKSGGTAQGKIGFDTAIHTGNAAGTLNTLTADAKSDGTEGNATTLVFTTATNGAADYMNLAVQVSGVTKEVFPDVNMDPTSADYVVDQVNDENSGSDLIVLTDLFAATSSPNNRPANATVTLAGGDNGLTSLDDNDFIGSPVANEAAGTGLRSFDSVPDLGLLIVPGRATAGMHNAMVTYCEATRFGSIFAILDPPSNKSAQQMVTYVKSTALLKELTEFAAIYWPRVKISNPDKTIFGSADQIVVYPSGWIAGRYAANDSATQGGVYEAPAGVDFGRLTNVIGLETDEVKDEAKRDLISGALINPIVGLPGLPIHMDGADTLKTTGPFPTIGERRGVIFIEQSLKGTLVFSKHRKIKAKLLKELERTTRTFMLIQMRNDAFATDDPKTAFSLDFGFGPGTINPPSEAFAKRVNAHIGIATAKPAKYIILRVGQDTRALEQELAAAA